MWCNKRCCVSACAQEGFCEFTATLGFVEGPGGFTGIIMPFSCCLLIRAVKELPGGTGVVAAAHLPGTANTGGLSDLQLLAFNPNCCHSFDAGPKSAKLQHCLVSAAVF